MDSREISVYGQQEHSAYNGHFDLKRQKLGNFRWTITVGAVTALATEVFLGDPARFAEGEALASYVGMIPSEYSSGGRQWLGGLSKQGNALLRFCLVRGSDARRTPRSRLEALLPAQAVAEGIRESEDRRRSQTRDSAVDHVVRSDRLSRVLSPQPDAAEERWCPCGDARQALWSCSTGTGDRIRPPAFLHPRYFA